MWMSEVNFDRAQFSVQFAFYGTIRKKTEKTMDQKIKQVFEKKYYLSILMVYDITENK